MLRKISTCGKIQCVKIFTVQKKFAGKKNLPTAYIGKIGGIFLLAKISAHMVYDIYGKDLEVSAFSQLDSADLRLTLKIQEL